MKLAIFIPAYNEEQTIGKVIAEVPDFVKRPACVKGISEQKIFVVDDGSTDGTVKMAHEALKMVEHSRTSGHKSLERPFTTSGLMRDHLTDEVIEIKPNRGLANAFKVGLQASLDWGADLIVHLDADSQYNPAEIPLLLVPILKGEADMVTGDRQVEKLTFLGWPRRYGNMLGSWFLRALTGLQIRDASCGFRAYNKKAAPLLEVHSTHTYTHETLIAAKYKGIRLMEVPITFCVRAGEKALLEKVTPGEFLKSPHKGHFINYKYQRSRLTKNLLKHIIKSFYEILKAWGRYRK